ncbi:MAG: MarR family transcriptional regulator [Nocardioides sp.]|nr:MarR family transcriptional regulator [Nocardioides sp.]
MTTDRHAAVRQIESEVGVLIRRVKRVITDRATALHPDLHPVTYLMLTRVIEVGPVRAADIVDSLGMDKGGVSRHVQTLVDLGFVEREPDPADRRAMLIVATDLARTRVVELQRQRSEYLDERLSDWSDDDIAAFSDALGRYNRALSD